MSASDNVPRKPAVSPQEKKPLSKVRMFYGSADPIKGSTIHPIRYDGDMLGGIKAVVATSDIHQAAEFNNHVYEVHETPEHLDTRMADASGHDFAFSRKPLHIKREVGVPGNNLLRKKSMEQGASEGKEYPMTPRLEATLQRRHQARQESQQKLEDYSQGLIATHNSLVNEIKSHPNFARNLEDHRVRWANHAKNNGIKDQSNFLSIQANKHGEIISANPQPLYANPTQDMIHPTTSREPYFDRSTLDHNGECPDCDYFRKRFELESGRKVEPYEDYPGWDRDWNHSHR